MINADTRAFDFYTYGTKDEYGQAHLSEEVQGSIKMAIYVLSQNVTTNVNYKDASYIAITHDKNINDNYVIKYGDKKLKVLYCIEKGRYRQAFLSEM